LRARHPQRFFIKDRSIEWENYAKRTSWNELFFSPYKMRALSVINFELLASVAKEVDTLF
tara:strand:- start:591 stop:770 length:180 start_codon:yes stop_codon:yes gene_type:complete